MATGNFNFENRCILVTNDDIDCGNIPDLGDYVSKEYNSYCSRKITDSYYFQFFDIVLTFGYYSDACLDYIDKKDCKDLEYYFYPDDYTTKKELFEDIAYSFDISVNKCYKLCRNKTIEESFYIIDDYLKEQEEKKINKKLDDIKKMYGYKELYTYARFSNGETIYRELN